MTQRELIRRYAVGNKGAAHRHASNLASQPPGTPKASAGEGLSFIGDELLSALMATEGKTASLPGCDVPGIGLRPQPAPQADSRRSPRPVSRIRFTPCYQLRWITAMAIDPQRPATKHPIPISVTFMSIVAPIEGKSPTRRVCGTVSGRVGRIGGNPRSRATMKSRSWVLVQCEPLSKLIR
ncbi:hypothetical protein J2X43_003370 [Rhizobium sp. BE258]|nr:hypothetical protein [Rhizobium sp. BE258]